MEIIQTTDLEKIPPELRMKAEPVADVREVSALFDEFLATLHDSGGLGLAATQVGIPRRFLLVHYDPPAGGGPDEEEAERLPLTFLINPEIVKRSEESLQWREGCLSLPGYVGTTTRAKSVKVKGQNRFGKTVTVKAEGLYACALQHELDHLDGILFIDHAAEVKRESPEQAQEDAIVE